jgi:hypothetical protein
VELVEKEAEPVKPRDEFRNDRRRTRWRPSHDCSRDRKHSSEEVGAGVAEVVEEMKRVEAEAGMAEAEGRRTATGLADLVVTGEVEDA